MNVFSFTGNLGQDCEQRHTANGDAVVSFSVAVRSGYGDRESTMWVRCGIFGRRGESLMPYLRKGQQVAVTGELSLSNWADREGIQRSSLELRVTDVTLIGKRDDSGAQNTNYAPQQQQKRTQAPQRASAPPPPIEDLDNPIPF